MISAESIDIASLPWVTQSDRHTLPSRPGIYFVLDLSGNVRYIGLSKNLRIRWARHHKSKILQEVEGVKIAYLIVSNTSLLAEIEVALIRHFKPDLNFTDGGESGGRSRHYPEGTKMTTIQIPRRLKEEAKAIASALFYGDKQKAIDIINSIKTEPLPDDYWDTY